MANSTFATSPTYSIGDMLTLRQTAPRHKWATDIPISWKPAIVVDVDPNREGKKTVLTIAYLPSGTERRCFNAGSTTCIELGLDSEARPLSLDSLLRL